MYDFFFIYCFFGLGRHYLLTIFFSIGKLLSFVIKKISYFTYLNKFFFYQNNVDNANIIINMRMCTPLSNAIQSIYFRMVESKLSTFNFVRFQPWFFFFLCAYIYQFWCNYYCSLSLLDKLMAQFLLGNQCRIINLNLFVYGSYLTQFES